MADILAPEFVEGGTFGGAVYGSSTIFGYSYTAVFAALLVVFVILVFWFSGAFDSILPDFADATDANRAAVKGFPGYVLKTPPKQQLGAVAGLGLAAAGKLESLGKTVVASFKKGLVNLGLASAPASSFLGAYARDDALKDCRKYAEDGSIILNRCTYV